MNGLMGKLGQSNVTQCHADESQQFTTGRSKMTCCTSILLEQSDIDTTKLSKLY